MTDFDLDSDLCSADGALWSGFRGAIRLVAGYASCYFPARRGCGSGCVSSASLRDGM